MTQFILMTSQFVKPSGWTVRTAVDVAAVVVLFVASHAVYKRSAGHVQSCDSAYSLVVAERLLADGSADLSGCVSADPAEPLPYQLARRPDPRHPDRPPGVYYGYPLGSSVLSVPWVWEARRRGLSTLHPDGTANRPVEDVLQRRVAARVSAAVVVLFYLLCRFWCPPAVCLLLAGGFAVGSPVWSTLSRGLWSHTWMVLWLTAGLILLAGRRSNAQAGRPVPPAGWRTDVRFGLLLGTCLFWVAFVRAHGVLSAAAIGLYLLLHHRRLLVVTVGAGGLWSAALVAVSLHHFGTPTPPSVYDPSTIDGRDVLWRLAGLMVAPSRGLLVFCPYLLVVAGVLVLFRRHLTDVGLLLPAGVAVAAHTAVFACYNGWHAGSSYGPRYFADVLPWFVLATATAARALRDVGGRRAWPAAAALAVCFGWGAWVHGRGANSEKAWLWNHRAAAVGQEAAVWEWRHPQFLCGKTFDVNPDGSIRE